MAESFGMTDKNLIKEAGYESLVELYRASGIPGATLSRIINDKQEPMNKTLRTLAPYLKMSHDYLIRLAGYLPYQDYKYTCINPDAHDEPAAAADRQ